MKTISRHFYPNGSARHSNLGSETTEMKPRQQQKTVGASLPLFPLFTHAMKPRHTSQRASWCCLQLTFATSRDERLCGEQERQKLIF